MSSNLLGFAKELAQTKPNDLPEKFLYLDRLLERSTAPASFKYDVVSLEILPVLLLTLRQDFTNIEDGWNIAVDLSTLSGVFLCIKVEKNDKRLKDRSVVFLEKYLPQGIDSFIQLIRNLQERYSLDKSSQQRQMFIDCMNSVMKNLVEVLTFHSDRESLFKQVLTSPKMMELFLSDDRQICLSVIKFFKEILASSRVSSRTNVFCGLSKKIKEDYVNELLYKLFVFDNPQIGKESVQALILLCQLDSSVPGLLSEKFKGLPIVLQRRGGQGIGMELYDLLEILRQGKAIGSYSTAMRKENFAASRIQALWRGYRTRKQLIKANEAMKLFQNSYRKRKRDEAERKEYERERAEIQYRAVLDHYRRLREFKMRQIQAIEILPASQVEKFLEVQRLESATKIQAFFRGYLQRRLLNKGLRNRLVAERAARTIQRNFRRYRQKKQADLDRRIQRLEYLKPSLLTEEKREEIIDQIETWRRERAPRPMSDQDFQELYSRTQEHVERYVRTNRAWRRVEQRQRVLLHMMNNDSEFLLSNYSTMKNVMQPSHETDPSDKYLDQAAKFLTHPSSAVRYRARQQHIESLKYARAPWYKSLQSTSFDDDDEFEDEDMKNLGLHDSYRNDILNNPTRYEYEKQKFFLFEPNLSNRSLENSK